MNEIVSDKETVLALGADHAQIVAVDKIPFEPSLRQLCESNQCGNYGTNWTCPPYVGDIDTLMAQLKKYKQAIIFQKIYKLEDSFDIEGMQSSLHNFRELTNTISNALKPLTEDFLTLSAGGCGICDRCTARDHLPCRNPDLAYASLEAYGIQVTELSRVCGLNYINGQNTVTFFGGIFFGPVE